MNRPPDNLSHSILEIPSKDLAVTVRLRFVSFIEVGFMDDTKNI